MSKKRIIEFNIYALRNKNVNILPEKWPKEFDYEGGGSYSDENILYIDSLEFSHAYPDLITYIVDEGADECV